MGLLNGKRALVTGACKGIGRGIALTFAAEGATVGVNDIINDHVSRRTTELAARHGAPASFHQADVATRAGVTGLMDEFARDHGCIDILVNNAISPDQDRPVFEVDEVFWYQVMDLSLKGYFFAAQRAAWHMVDQGTGGRIASVHSRTPRTSTGPSTATAKARLRRLVKSLAVDLAGSGGTANCIAPGAISNRLPLAQNDSDINAVPDAADDLSTLIDALPSRRGGLPSDIANAVLYLCGDLGAYVNGETILVAGGLVAGDFGG